MEQLRPLNDRVMIETIPPAQKIGLIHVPEVAQRQNAAEGIVKAVGPGQQLPDGTRAPMSVGVGDRVLFQPRPMSEIEARKTKAGERTVVVHDGDILAIIDP
jgi:co-chaperonin GroES (HSP10)